MPKKKYFGVTGGAAKIVEICFHLIKINERYSTILSPNKY